MSPSRLLRFACVAVALSTPHVLGKLYTDPSQLPASNLYDYVVVGAGAGGAVVATRLSENPHVKVLVLEAGVNNEGLENVAVPALLSTLSPNTPIDWNYTTTPQAALNNRVIPYPRGRLLGGSTSINFMGWTRGSKDDFDRFASTTSDSGWSWNALQPYMKKAEHLRPPQDGHDTSGQVDPSIHGKSGPLSITLPGWLVEIDPLVIATTRQLSQVFPYNVDMNSGNTIGLGWTQATIHNGSRASSAEAYLQPALHANRPNLDVVINAQVTKVIQTGTHSGLPVLRGVQFAASSTSSRFAVNATKEVILSAGSINTAQLLLLSGVGPTADLTALGIHTIVNSPGVGKNLIDHPILANVFNITKTTSLIDNFVQNATFAGLALAEWEATRQGPMLYGPCSQLGWFRVPPATFGGLPDPSAGKRSAHWELLPFDGFVSTLGPPPTSGHYLTLFSAVVSPSSRGSVTLASTNPFDFPVIDPNFFDDPRDIAIMKAAVKEVLRFASAPAWSGFVATPSSDLLAATASDASLAAYARNGGGTLFHPVGTAAMGAPGDADAVVNTDLTVRGVYGLRVVDASVLPFIPAAHTQAAVYIIAERASDLIKAAAA
ncbi:aryl-alcohol-oxidase from pleurotus Eryingii [Gloeopeniophorella convolvens]|nr:aryl-alcohol-oxidase from pleurotus Eryingii [Gloeopeniophorella convolvens]